MNRNATAKHPRELIDELRVKRGYPSLRALAIAAGISQPTLSRFMKGTTDTMEVASWLALARELKVTVSELLGEIPLSETGEVQELVNTIILLDESHRSALLAAAHAMYKAAKK